MGNNVNLERLLTNFGRQEQRQQNLPQIGVGNTFSQRLASSVGAIGQGMLGGTLRAAEAAGAPITTKSAATQLRERLAGLNPQENEKDREEFLKIVGTMQGPDAVLQAQELFRAADERKAAAELEKQKRTAVSERAKSVAQRLRGRGYFQEAMDVLKEVQTGDTTLLSKYTDMLNRIEQDEQKAKAEADGDGDDPLKGASAVFERYDPTVQRMVLSRQLADGTIINVGFVEGAEQEVDVDAGLVVTTSPTGEVTTADLPLTPKQQEELDQQQEEERQKKKGLSAKLLQGNNALNSQFSRIRRALTGIQSNVVSKVFGQKAEAALQEAFPIAYGSFLQESEVAEIDNAVATIRANEALGALQELKEASSTGGSGLGATNTVEFNALMERLAKIDPLNPQTIEANIQAMEKHYANLLRMNAGQDPVIEWVVPEEQADGSITYSVNESYAPYISEALGRLYYTLDNGETFVEVPFPYTNSLGQTITQ